MNQARSGRYYAEDFQPGRPIPWMAMLALLVVATILFSGAVFFGDRRGFERGRAFQSQLARPTCPAPAPAPTFSRQECVSACFSKDRMGRVKPNKGIAG